MEGREWRPTRLATKCVFTGPAPWRQSTCPCSPWNRCRARETKVSKRGLGLHVGQLVP